SALVPGSGFASVEDEAGAAPPPPQAEPSTEPGTETGDTESGAPEREETAEKTPWAEVSTTDELLEHEALKPHIERIREEARDEGQSAAQSRLQPILQNQRDHYAKVAKAAEEFTADWRDLIEQGTLDSKEFQQFMRRHGDTIQAIQGVHYSQGAEWGGSAILNSLGKEAGLDNSDIEGINRQLLYAFQQQWQGQAPDTTFVQDFMRKATKAIKAEALEEGKKQGAKMAEERLKREMKALERRNGTTPADVRGRGGGGGDRSNLNTIKGINAAVRSGQISQSEGAEHIQRIRSGAAG
ncbi:MAG: hypothetical protein ACE5FA_08265, partial [Dehalococcoidia bacterium]